VPAARVEDVLAAAEEIERTEDAIRAAVEGGSFLCEARRIAGYHDLQNSVRGAGP
jgi:4-hydroxy-4-methyl-2-oxoglutarate aldolase